MTKTDLLQLRSLADAQYLVAVDCIPSSFKDDFDQFFFGKTLVKKMMDAMLTREIFAIGSTTFLTDIKIKMLPLYFQGFNEVLANFSTPSLF